MLLLDVVEQHLGGHVEVGALQELRHRTLLPLHQSPGYLQVAARLRLTHIPVEGADIAADLVLTFRRFLRPHHAVLQRLCRLGVRRVQDVGRVCQRGLGATHQRFQARDLLARGQVLGAPAQKSVQLRLRSGRGRLQAAPLQQGAALLGRGVLGPLGLPQLLLRQQGVGPSPVARGHGLHDPGRQGAQLGRRGHLRVAPLPLVPAGRRGDRALQLERRARQPRPQLLVELVRPLFELAPLGMQRLELGGEVVHLLDVAQPRGETGAQAVRPAPAVTRGAGQGHEPLVGHAHTPARVLHLARNAAQP